MCRNNSNPDTQRNRNWPPVASAQFLSSFSSATLLSDQNFSVPEIGKHFHTRGKWQLRSLLSISPGKAESYATDNAAIAAGAPDPAILVECRQAIVDYDLDHSLDGMPQTPHLPLDGSLTTDSEKHLNSDLVWLQVPTIQSNGSV